MAKVISHDRCSFERELLSLRGLLDTIEESVQLASDQPEKADIEKDQILESLIGVSDQADALYASIEQHSIPTGRCGSQFCCHCRSEAT